MGHVADTADQQTSQMGRAHVGRGRLRSELRCRCSCSLPSCCRGRVCTCFTGMLRRSSPADCLAEHAAVLFEHARHLELRQCIGGCRSGRLEGDRRRKTAMTQSRVAGLLMLALLTGRTENGRGRGGGGGWTEAKRSSLRLRQRRAMNAACRAVTADRCKHRCSCGRDAHAHGAALGRKRMRPRGGLRGRRRGSVGRVQRVQCAR